MDLGTLDAQGFFELLQRLEGSGYSKDEDGTRAGELRAWAEIAAMVSQALDDATASLFLQSAESALDLYERTLYLLQGASLPVADRRKRLLAYRQSLPLNETRLRSAFGAYLAALTGSTLRPSNVEALSHRASPSTGFVVGRREPAATLKQQQRDLATALERGLPARALSGGVSQRDAVWGDALEPASLKLTPAVTVPTQTKARVAPLEFQPGQQVSRAQWLELQAMLCWKSHGFSLDQDHQGRTVMCLDVVVGPSAAVGIDGPTVNGSIDWQNRFVQACGVVSNATITDPTQATTQEHAWLPASKLGPSSGGYYQTLTTLEEPTVATAIALHVDGSGNLEVVNTQLSGTKHVTLMIRCTPPYAPSSSADTQPWIDAQQLQYADMLELYRAQTITDVAPGQFGGAFAGALRRVFYSGPLFHQVADGVPQSVVLDSSEDWRHRWVQVVSVGHYDAAGDSFPLPSTAGQVAGASHAEFAPQLFYTGTGTGVGLPVQDPNQQPLTHALTTTALSAPDIWLYARSSDGALMCEMKQGLSANHAASMIALVTATEHDDASSIVKPVPLHATQLQTLDLEQPQNCGCFAQGQQGGVPRYLATDPAARALPTCPPLGIISEGHSPVRPVSWRVRERLGNAADSTYEVRQKLLGQRKRIVSLLCPAGVKTPLDDFNLPAQLAPGVNDQMDFRDRFVWVEGRLSASDITVANATPASDSAAEPFLALLYTGPGTIAAASASTSVGLYAVVIAPSVFVQFEFSRGNAGQGFHSRLVIANESGADVYVHCAIEASGFLGLSDRRAAGQPV